MKIKHTIISLATALLVPLTALCQSVPPPSSIQLYGRVDASVNLQRFSATATQPASRGTFVSSDTSFWGIRGSEDLGGGLRAFFKLEHGFNVDTGNQSSPTTYWNRETFVGLGHSTYGSIQLGSLFAPSISLTGKVDPFRRGNTGAILTLFQQGGPAGPRGYLPQHNNAVQYLSPTFGGFIGRVFFATTEGAAPFGNPRSVSLEFTRDRLFAGLVVDRVNTAGSAAGQPNRTSVANTTLSGGATYRFDAFKLHGYYIRNKIEGTTGMTGGMLGISVPVGSGEIQATVQRRNVDDAANSDGQLFAVQYMHFLSKRTSVYVGTGRQRNDGNAAFGVWPSRVDAAREGFPRAGSDVSGYQIGMRHVF